MTRRASILLASATLFAGLLIGGQVHAWLNFDGCLDAGGRWAYDRQACDFK